MKTARLIGPAAGTWRGQCYVYELDPPITFKYAKAYTPKRESVYSMPRAQSVKVTARAQYVAVSAIDNATIMEDTINKLKELGMKIERPFDKSQFHPAVTAFGLHNPDDEQPIAWAGIATINGSSSHKQLLTKMGYEVTL